MANLVVLEEKEGLEEGEGDGEAYDDDFTQVDA